MTIAEMAAATWAADRLLMKAMNRADMDGQPTILSARQHLHRTVLKTCHHQPKWQGTNHCFDCTVQIGEMLK